MRRILGLTLLLGLALLGSAAAADTKAAPQKPAKPKDGRPAGTYDSGVITMEELTKDIQTLIAKQFGINVNYILPKNWEVVTQLHQGTGKTPGVFSTISRRKTSDPNDATDFIYELDIFEPDILAGMPANLSKDAESKEINDRFKAFQNGQITINLKAGLKILSKQSDIVPKPYGPDQKHPRAYFVPIHWQVPPPKGSKNAGPADLFTFTSLTGGHVWQLKFLVADGQLSAYSSLIALMINNTFGLTDADQKKLEQNTANVEKKLEETTPNKNSKTKTKAH